MFYFILRCLGFTRFYSLLLLTSPTWSYDLFDFNLITWSVWSHDLFLCFWFTWSVWIYSYVSNWVYFTQSDFFFVCWSPSSLCTIFYSVYSDRDEVLLINSSANVFVFADFSRPLYKDWLTYSGGTDRPGELSYNFSISNDLTQMVHFPTRIRDCDSHTPALLLTLVFVLQRLSLNREILIMLSQFQLVFQQIQDRMLRFIA